MLDSRPSQTSVLFSASEMMYQPGAVITGDAKFYTFLEGRIAAAASAKTDNPLEIRSRQLVKSTYEMEQIFHSACPTGRISRKTARFACSSLEDCLVYACEQYKGPFYIYEVEMPDAVAAPMALTGYARKVAKNEWLLAKAIAAEYWDPKRSWHYWEYLDSAMTILKSGTRFIPPLALHQAVQDRKDLYDEDATNAGKIDWLSGQPRIRTRHKYLQHFALPAARGRYVLGILWLWEASLSAAIRSSRHLLASSVGMSNRSCR